MGYSGGTEVFNGIANVIIKLVEDGDLSQDNGQIILAATVRNLRDGDWDTYDESVAAFEDYPWIIDVFEDEIGGIKDWLHEINDDEDDEPMSQEERRRFEARPDFPGWEAL